MHPDASSPADRLAAVFARYDVAFQAARPGTASAAALARARLDLALALEAAGEVLAPEVQAQLERDCATLLVTTVALS